MFLGLADFPTSEPVHVVGPLGATFLRQRATHLRVDPSVSRGASSSGVPPLPSSTGAADRKSTRLNSSHSSPSRMPSSA